MNSGSQTGGGTYEIRYAPYIEDAHQVFLNEIQAWATTDIGVSPFSDYAFVDIEDSFTYIYDMFEAMMHNLDVRGLFDQLFLDSTVGPLIDNLVSAQAIELEDDLEQRTLPEFEAGMRDINAVQSSTFVVGKALLMAQKTKSLSKYGAEASFRMIPVAEDRWKTTLDWNNKVVEMEAKLYNMYIQNKVQMDNHNYDLRSKNTLWPFTVLDYVRAGLGALQGATNSRSTTQGPDPTMQYVGLGVAAIGAAALLI